MAATHRDEISAEEQDVMQGRTPELTGSRGGLKYFRPTGGLDAPTSTQFHGRLLPPAIHRPEERVR